MSQVVNRDLRNISQNIHLMDYMFKQVYLGFISKTEIVMLLLQSAGKHNASMFP